MPPTMHACHTCVATATFVHCIPCLWQVEAELKEQIEKMFSIKNPKAEHIQENLDHGRIEKRTCEVIDYLDFLDTKKQWNSLKTIVRITSERTDKKTDKTSLEIRYYISSLESDAKLHNESIRKHWSIENNLHWCLDVVMKEDGQLNYTGNSAENMNIIKKMALGLIARDKSRKISKARKIKAALMEDEYREKLLFS